MKKKIYAVFAIVTLVAIVGFLSGSALSKNAGEMQQLKTFLGSVKDDQILPDHLFKTVKDKNGNVISAIFLHFDKPVGQESKILYVGDAVPGKFCDSPEVQELIKKGYVHFHHVSSQKDHAHEGGHGGKGGEQGFWLRHVSVASNEVDYNFMPTQPPTCNITELNYDLDFEKLCKDIKSINWMNMKPMKNGEFISNASCWGCMGDDGMNHFCTIEEYEEYISKDKK